MKFTVIILTDNSDNGAFDLKHVEAETAVDAALSSVDPNDNDMPYIVFPGHLPNALSDNDINRIAKRIFG